MAESFSVKAILSAKDSGFSSTLKSASSTLDTLGSKLKSGFGMGILQGMGQAAFGALSNGARELVGEINSSNKAWKTFEGNMKIIHGEGKKTDKLIGDVKKTLQDYATETIYSSSDMASSYAQLAAVGIKSADKLVTGFGGLAGAAEDPAQAMKTLSQQGVQMAAKPKVAWQDFKLMLEQTPAGMAAVAKEMGMTTSEMVTAVQDGKIKTQDFFNAVQKVGNSDGFKKLATEYKSVDQAMDGLKETLGNKLMPAFDALSQGGIGAISGIIDSLDGIDGAKLATGVSSILTRIEEFGSKAKLYLDAAKEAFSGVGSEVGKAFSAVRTSLAEVNGAFGSTESVDSFKGAMTSLAEGIKAVAGFITEHSDSIATLIKYLPAIVIGFKGLQIAKAVVPGVAGLASGIGSLASKVGGGLASKLFGVSKAQESVGSVSATSGAQMLNSAKAFALMGVGVLLVAAGFALLAQSAIALANAGGLAIGIMAGMVLAVVGLGIGMAALLKSLAPMSAQLMPVATAFLAMGAAVFLIAAGFAILAYSSIALANAGGAAIGVMVGMVAAIALLAVGAAALGTALTAGAVGFVAFGAAVLMVGAGFALIGVSALLAATALTMIAAVLPQITEYGNTGAAAIAVLGAGMLAFAAGAAAAGVAAAVLGAGLIVAGVGIAALAVGIVVLAAGIAALAVGVALAAVSMALAAGGLALLNLALPQTIALGTSASAAMLALSVGLLAMGAGALVAGAGMAVFGAAMVTGAGGTLLMVAALKGVNSSMKSIAKNAKTTQKSLKSMQSSVNAVESGLSALGDKAKSAMNSLKSAFDDTANKAKSAGEKTGTGFAMGIQGGMVTAVAVASSGVVIVVARLNAGYSGAYSAGAYISMGFAAGMRSQLGVIESVAARMAVAAEKAIRAKAQIHSPSKVTDKLGTYYGKGFANGIADTEGKVWKAAENLVAIPKVATPDFSGGFNGEMSDDYEYFRNAEYIFTIPFDINGREFARATAKYSQEELDRRQTREDRKSGKV